MARCAAHGALSCPRNDDDDDDNDDDDDDDNDDDDNDDNDATRFLPAPGQSGTSISATITTSTESLLLPTTDHVIQNNTNSAQQDIDGLFENMSTEISSVISQYVQSALTEPGNHSYNIEIPFSLNEEDTE